LSTNAAFISSIPVVARI